MTFLSQTGVDFTQPLVNAGVIGVILLWLMYRVETRLKALENSDNRKTRALLLLVISLKTSTDGARAEARTIVKEIDVAEGGKE